MIQLLSTKYPKHIAYILFLILLSSFKPAYGNSVHVQNYGMPGQGFNFNATPKRLAPEKNSGRNSSAVAKNSNAVSAKPVNKRPQKKPFIGGPSQPEMSSFKSVGTDNMVNLFTGDFSYNIPLLDVGGYPVNLFYNGGITPEQEASWVGLGWNINPGTVSRNMRGVPDDFDGSDKLIQTQQVKPNITWGFNAGASMELVGIDGFERFTGSIGASLGASFNNYLGPALDFGIKAGTAFKLAGKVAPEKNADTTFGLKLSAGFSANANSRYGFTFSPNVSLSAANFFNAKSLSTGVGIGTNYNSRTGIKQLNLYEQTAYDLDAASGIITDAGRLSTTISFAKPSYIPTLRTPMSNLSFSGHAELGSGIFGGYVSGEVEGYYQKSWVDANDVIQTKPLVGYLYYQNANGDPNAVMDFTRLNDNEVTNHTPVISAAQYAYDVFSIQGEGTGGTIRPYRNDYGYVRDNRTGSRDRSTSVGADIGPPGHFGGNFNTIKTPTTIGDWGNGNKLRTALKFSTANGDAENVYFRNPGEMSVLNENQFQKIGGTDLVRFKLGGSGYAPTVEPVLEQFSKNNNIVGTSSMLTPELPERKKRSQVTSYLTAKEASEIGLETKIRNYDATTVLNNDKKLIYAEINRVSEYRKAHHISQINVTEADGKRYVYGIPVYNIQQKDFSFSVNAIHDADDRVSFTADEASTNSEHLSGSSTTKRDGYVQITQTPAYAHAFLLSGLLSPDYVDVTGDGITEDDLGNAVKFNYTKLDGIRKWRTPLTSQSLANANPGNLTETKDDKGIVSYGERESWYLHSIESKTMIAIFTLENRNDGKGSTGELQGINSADNTTKRLKKIDLFSKADLKLNGIVAAKPIKTVWFEYNYTLCQGTPDNTSGGGKLTLEGVYFTFNGKNRINKNKYAFSYGTTAQDNPAYAANTSDRWGTYKPKADNPKDNNQQAIKNSDYPYSLQSTYPQISTDQSTKNLIDKNAAAWSLKTILLPSGGQIAVEYESDDYAFVQDRRAATMMKIVGFGRDNATPTNKLYNIGSNNFPDNDKVYIGVSAACTSNAEVFQKYLQGISQVAFKLAVKMPKGIEYVKSYATIAEYGYVANAPTIWIRLNSIDGMSPLVITAIEYLREQLPGQAYSPGYDLSESDGFDKIVNMLTSVFSSFGEFLKNPANKFRENRYAQTVDLSRSFVRLNDVDGFKYGGGVRVKSVRLKDNWQQMTGQYTSEYGQQYDYTTTEIFNGSERTISSGVASYEPSIGSEENPFQSILQVANKLPLGPTSFGAIEMPVLDAFFPAPVVGYSKVTVRSIKKNYETSDKKVRSGIGRQVTEFYTAKDFPVYYNHTSIDPSVDLQEHKSSLFQFFYKYAFDSRALSQGFVVETNDMHGKMKSQASYAENDPATRISYTENFYRNTGSKGLAEKFDFAFGSKGGEIKHGNMGIDIELMTDTREFSVKSTSLEIQGQLDLFPVVLPFWLPFIWGVSGESENTYRAVTTTKVINYHGVLDSIVAIDKGSQVSTKNLVYDAETGEVLVNRTNNEFDEPVYSVSYPAYWAYSGMGLAYKNIDAIYSGVKFRDGKIIEGISQQEITRVFESGDEIYLIDPGSAPGDGCGSKLPSYEDKLLWAFDINKNTSSLTNPAPEFLFINKLGQLSNRDGVKLRIVRSGKRNMLGAPLASITSMHDPRYTSGGVTKLVVDNNIAANSANKVVNATAVEYKEKWQTDNDVIKKLKTVIDPVTCIRTEEIDCNGYLEKNINPYRKGLLGNFRSHRSMVFYENRVQTNPTSATNLKADGYLSNFGMYWGFNAFNNMVPDVANTKWVWNVQVTRVNAKGLELETKDALDIYTAAQYGYNKTTPVGIATNARYNEMFYEGFEDKDYQESINTAWFNPCALKHIDLSGMPNSQVGNAAAHTGKYALAVNANSTAARTFEVKNAVVENFSIQTTPDTVKELTSLGGNHAKISAVPSSAPQYAPTFSASNLGMSLDHAAHNVVGEIVGSTVKYYMLYKTTQYTKVTVPGTYSFNISTFQNDVPLGYDPVYIFNMSAISISIKNLNNEEVAYFTVNSTNSPQIKTAFLTCDTYVIECLCSVDIQRAYNGTDGFHMFSGGFSYSANTNTVSYKSPYPQNMCFFNKPIAAESAMLNPVFSVPVNKKMVFSAWVKESCAPCSTYTNNQVKLQFNDGSNQLTTLQPSGPVIEGWQRYEGYFTAPTGSTQMTMSFVNNSSSTIYFDDIRVHPYNANMKSYVYDPVNLRLTSELDANNYASFYEYDEEGGLIRTKAETKEGVKTINETRSFKQRGIQTIQ